MVCGRRAGYPTGKTEVGNWTFSNYGVNYQVFGNPDAGDNAYNSEGNNPSLAQITDGTSNTIGFAEKYRRCGTCGSLWGHGSWDASCMALFAYGPRHDTNGAMSSVGYTSNSSWPGAVGLSAEPVANPDPWDTNC